VYSVLLFSLLFLKVNCMESKKSDSPTPDYAIKKKEKEERKSAIE
jgi:hypothetical protein